MRIPTAFFPLAAAAILLTGCGNEEPATKAVAQANAAVERLRPDAQFAPTETKAVEVTVARMNDNLAKEKYEDVIKDIPVINNEYKAAQEAAVSLKTLTAASQTEWQTLNTEVPQAVQELETRVDKLSSGALPKEITKETLATAKTELADMKATWTEATAAASAGDIFEAANKGRTVQGKAEKLKDDLGMSASASVASL